MEYLFSSERTIGCAPEICGDRRQTILNACKCLYDAKDNVPVVADFLGIVRTRLSVTFLLLIAPALRERLRIRQGVSASRFEPELEPSERLFSC